MLLGDTVKFAHVTLGLVPEILDPVDVVVSICKQDRMVDAVVLERADIERIVASPAIRIDNAVGYNFALNYGHQSIALGIRNDTRVNLPTPLK